MVSITLSVPEDVKEQMDLYPDINWSAVAREAIKKKIEMLEKFKAFVGDSEMSGKYAEKLGKELNKKVSKKY